MFGAGSMWRRLVGAAVVVLALVVAMASPWRSHSTPVAAAVSGISLLPAAGQFTPLPGTPVLDSRNGTGISSPNLAPGSTLMFSVTTVGGVATGVPTNASAVVLEYNTTANFAGVLSTGAAAGVTDTSLTFAANVERNGFDIVTPAANGTVALAITGFSPIPSGAVLSKLVVRLHGYYSGASTTTAGSTYVGYDPALLASSSSNNPSGFARNGTGTSGPLAIGGGSYSVQVTGNAGVPSDGSATAVALQTIVQDPTCSGGFSLTPAGSGRSDYDGAFTSGQDGENFDLIALPASGQLTLQLLGCTGTATVTIRVRGYFSAPTVTTPGASFVPVQRKVFDTTTSTGTASCPTTADSPKLAAHSGCTIQVLGTGGIPSDGVSGLAAQVVAVNPGHDGWLGLYSDDGVAHTATLWYGPTGRTSNFEVASYTDVNPDGTVYVWNGGDYPVDVVIRAHGYYRAPAPPGAPGNVTVTVSGSTTTVSWTAPTTDGGAAIGGFVVDGEDGSQAFVDWPGTSASFPNGQGDIGYTVAAVNEVGDGDPALSSCDAWRGAIATPTPSDTASPDPSDSAPVADASKQAALSAPPTATTLPSPSSAVVACAPSTADTTTVTAIKADALNDLHLDLYAMRQPTNSSGQRLAEYSSQEGTVTDSTTMNALLQSEAQGASLAWSSDQSAAQVNQRYQDARDAYADPDYVGYSDAKTVVDQWQSVQLTSSTTATAVFVGHDSFDVSSGWHDEQPLQYQLTLVLQNGHWRLQSRTETDLGFDVPDDDD
ncbi:MAG: hypothetical protein ACJ74O_17815 [Frankiaceae bacterium]